MKIKLVDISYRGLPNKIIENQTFLPRVNDFVDIADVRLEVRRVIFLYDSNTVEIWCS
jgi:hypothetical protein